MLACDEQNIEEVKKAIGFSLQIDIMNLFFNGGTFLFFDTEQAMNHHYQQVVGDDGPTRLNNYSGSARVYALTCSDKGEFLNENT